MCGTIPSSILNEKVILQEAEFVRYISKPEMSLFSLLLCYLWHISTINLDIYNRINGKC